VLWLVFFEEFQNVQAASIMGKSKKQMENLVYRAKLSLKSELEKEGFVYEDL
jgi:RNA polymerase sigma-70 factor (ECF subfamily)